MMILTNIYVVYTQQLSNGQGDTAQRNEVCEEDEKHEDRDDKYEDRDDKEEAEKDEEFKNC